MLNSKSACWLLAGLIALATTGLTGAQETTTEPPEGLREYTPQVYVLKGASAVIAPGNVVQNALIVIRDEKIVDVGTDETVTIPADARVLDMSGKTIYAGFIDGYSEQDSNVEQATGGSPYWNSNIVPQLAIADQYLSDSGDNRNWRSQGVVARLVAPNSGIIKGRSAVALTSDDANQRALLADDVALHVRLTVNRRSRGSGPSYPNSPMGAVALARQALYDARWYRDAWSAASADSQLSRPERDDALEALLPYLSGEQLVIFDTLNELYALRADRYAREFSLKAALLGSGEEYRRLEAIRAAGRTVIVPLDFPQPPDVSTDEVAGSVSLESLMHWDHAPENPGRLANAGIPIVLTSNGLSDRRKFLEQIRKAVSRGLSADQALKALTIEPAKLYGVESLLGTIEPGKLACLVVADGELFAAKGKVVETWVRGQRFEHEDQPRREVDGKWKMELAFNSGKPNNLTLTVNKGSGRMSGSISAGEGEDAPNSRLDTLSVSGAQLNGSFPAYAFDQQGVARFSVVIEPFEESWVGIGHLVWPDGKRVAARLLPVEEKETKPKADADNEESAKDKLADKEASPSDDKKESDEESLSATYPVNYPLGAFGRTEFPQPVKRLVIRNATIWTSGPQGNLDEADMLIGDGKILAVGTDLEVPEGTEELDASGMHLTAGLIDCHSHMASDGGINESGQAITAEVRIGDFIDCNDITIYRQLAGGLTTSNILHGSANPIGGQNQVIKLRWGLLDEAIKFSNAPAGVKFALGENVKRSTSRYPNSRMGVEQIIRDEFHAAKRYSEAWQSWKSNPTGMPPRRDLELEAIAEVVNGKRWIHCHSYRQDEILALIRTLDEFGITIGTFQHILEGYKVADAMAKHGAMASAFSDWWNYKMEVKDAIPYAGAIMHEAGLVVSFNSDDGELARHMNHEAAKAVKYGGVDPAEALKFVTLNPAKQLRIDQYVGSLEVGKHADFVLWSASPLSNFARCEQTWIDGAKYFDREEDAMLQAKTLEMRNSLVQKILSSGQKMRPRGSQNEDDPDRLWPREDIYCRFHLHDYESWFLDEQQQLQQNQHQHIQR